MQEGEQEALDLVLSQSAGGRHGAAAHGGATSLQLEQQQHTLTGEIFKFMGWKKMIQPNNISLLVYLVTFSGQQLYF